MHDTPKKIEPMSEHNSRETPSNDHHHPALFLIPDFEEDFIEDHSVRISRRLWQTSIFDLATLAAHHELKFPYQLMDVFLQRCNLEISVLDCPQKDLAQERLLGFQVLLYAEGVSPFTLPFSTNISINAYSGINSRDSEYLNKDLPEGLRSGITSKSTLVRVRALEPSLATNVFQQKLKLSRPQILNALSQLDNWLTQHSKDPRLRAFQAALLSSANITPVDQAILHLWTGIESLFPDIKAEVSFRIALYIACVNPDKSKRRELYDTARKSYGVRSAIAHGSHKRATFDDWLATWQLATSILKSILIRKTLPSEADLLKDLLG